MSDEMCMKIIINEDDFGINEPQTLSICESFRRGLVTQTTTVVNMPWFDKAVACAKDNHFFDRVGLHFNLTEGVPLSAEMRNCTFFCNKNGEFTGQFHRSLKTRLFLPPVCRNALKAECNAQIEKYLSAGYRMMHLDSHHHVHTDFSIATTLLPIANYYGFKTMRMSRTVCSAHTGFAKRFYKMVYNYYAKHHVPFAADAFTDLHDFMKFYKSLQHLHSVEIMLHPGLEIVQPGIENDPSVEEQEKFWRSCND